MANSVPSRQILGNIYAASRIIRHCGTLHSLDFNNAATIPQGSGLTVDRFESVIPAPVPPAGAGQG